MIIILTLPGQNKKAQVLLVVKALAAKDFTFKYLDFWIELCEENGCMARASW